MKKKNIRVLETHLRLEPNCGLWWQYGGGGHRRMRSLLGKKLLA